MNSRRYWPFPVPVDAQGPDATRRLVTFFEAARRLGFRAFDQGSLIGAVAPDGREGTMIPRRGVDGGLRRFWEVTLSQPDHSATPITVDGFENAADIVLHWLRGEDRNALTVSRSPVTAEALARGGHAP